MPSNDQSIHLQIQKLKLNSDSNGSLPAKSIVPSDEQVCDIILLIWKDEPASEDYDLEELLGVIKGRNNGWKLSIERLRTILESHNWYANHDKDLQIYSKKVRIPEGPESEVNLPRNVELRTISGDKQRGLFVTCDLTAGDLIFEDLPLVTVPAMDKLALMMSGKACPLCGSSVNHSQHAILMNDLDCRQCDAVWCSKGCKKNDVTHPILRHTRSKCKKINLSGWKKYENFCKQHIFMAGYSFGIVYICMILDKNGKNGIRHKFRSLAEISQRTRNNLGDSTSFDTSNGTLDPEGLESMWTQAFNLFKESFPESEGIDLDTYLNYIGKFNINQVSGQIFPVYSFINHDCEPNVYYEIDDKLKLKLYARKPIKNGEELSSTYVNPLHGVKLRRRELRVNWGFLCYCDRCNRELTKRKEKLVSPTPSIYSPRSSFSDKGRRKSSMRNARPDLQELLKNGQEFDLEIPDNLENHHRRRTSVRFDENVSVAL